MWIWVDVFSAGIKPDGIKPERAWEKIRVFCVFACMCNPNAERERLCNRTGAAKTISLSLFSLSLSPRSLSLCPINRSLTSKISKWMFFGVIYSFNNSQTQEESSGTRDFGNSKLNSRVHRSWANILVSSFLSIFPLALSVCLHIHNRNVACCVRW